VEAKLLRDNVICQSIVPRHKLSGVGWLACFQCRSPVGLELVGRLSAWSGPWT